jgi:exodeoxyribonuclease VII large subunit
MPPIEYSVSEFIALVNEVLEAMPARVTGEVSELKFAASGHAYFTLKDKETGFILPCTIWARDYALAGVTLELGMEIAAVGRANFYGPFGKLSFNAKSIELVGEGALKKAYELLKKKLTTEGLFAPEKKRPIPAFVRTIGVITSVRGAVIHDFSSNLGRYGFSVRILDSKVEGPESGRDLALSVRAMRTEAIDILVIIRGGGSIQSLAGFDNEALVREIATFPVPVLAGVGHHQDITLAALAADYAESTPSFVAALINSSWTEAATGLERSERRIWAGFEAIVRLCHGAEERFRNVLRAFQSRLEAARVGLEATGKLITQNDPNRQLRLGYSIVYHREVVVRSKQDAPPGSTVTIHTKHDIIKANIQKD